MEVISTTLVREVFVTECTYPNILETFLDSNVTKALEVAPYFIPLTFELISA